MPGKLDEFDWGVDGEARLAARRSGLLDRHAVAWTVLAILVLVTLALWATARQQVERYALDRFRYLVDSASERLVDRMEDYEQVLRGGAGLFFAHDTVTRGTWRTYVEALQLDEHLPGMQAMGFAQIVPRALLDEHERAVRAEGFPNYSVRPRDGRDPLTSIVYIEPFAGRNLRAFGFDMSSEPVRREAMERARDTGTPALSGKVKLVQETSLEVQPGFLIYLPVYHHYLPHATAAERRAAIYGFVYSPFRAFDLMHGVFATPGRMVGIELYDGHPHPDQLLFSSVRRDHTARFITDRRIEIAGHLWTARFCSSALFEHDSESGRPQLILFGGLLLDFTLFSLLYMNANHRNAMRAAAGQLERSRESFRSLVENMPGSVFRSRVDDLRNVHVSSGIEAITGESAECFLAGKISFEQLVHPDDKARVKAAVQEAIDRRGSYRVEYRMRRRDGSVRWVGENGRIILDETGRPQWLDGVMLDIDDRKRAEIAIRELAFNDPLTGLPNRRLLLDRLEQQLASSSRTGRHGALLFLDLDKFKTVNDTLGHDVGDLLLAEVANRLWTHVREDDTVARLGGDEFVVMLDAIEETRDDAHAAAIDVAHKILAELNRPYKLRERVVESGASIGVTLFFGHEASADQLLRRADRAMYRAKSMGRNRVVFSE